MTKRSGLILVLSVLLCVSMLFVSCKSGDTDTNDTNTSETSIETTTEPVKKEPIPQSEKIDYVSILEKWNEYISYIAPEEEEAMGANKMYTDNGDGTLIDRVDRGMFWEVTFKYIGYTHGRTVKLFSKQTGEQIGGAYVMLLGSNISYSFSYTGCVVEIATYTVEDDETVTVTYDYYDVNGDRLNEAAVAAEDRYDVSVRDAGDGYYFITVGDTVYLMYDDELVRSFERGEELLLPYTNYEYGEYNYYIPEWYEDEQTIYVINSDDVICAEYQISKEYDSREWYILANGNVLISYVAYCDEEESLYTYEDKLGNEVLLYNVILDVATGKTTAIPATYQIVNLLTPYSSEEKNVVFNGNYQYAEICKIVDGVLSEIATPVILDNDMKILAELPLMVKNQSFFAGMLDEDSMLVLGEMLTEENRGGVMYRVDATGVELYVDQSNPLYKVVENGFIYNGTLYNDRMQPLYELSEAEDYLLLNDRRTILVKVKDADDDDEFLLSLLMIENGALESVALADETDTFHPLEVGSRGFIVTVVDEFEVEEGEEEIPPEISQAFYSDDGTLLFSGEDIELLSDDGEAYLVACTSEGVTSYYVVR